MLAKRLCARRAAQNPVDGDRVRVTDPAGTTPSQTERVQKGLYRRFFLRGVGLGRDERVLHFSFVQGVVLKKLQHRPQPNAAQVGFRECPQAAPGRLDPKHVANRFIGGARADVALTQNGELERGVAELPGEPHEVAPYRFSGGCWCHVDLIRESFDGL